MSRSLAGFGILASLVAGFLYLNSFTHRHTPSPRAVFEIRMMAAALEAYKTDFGSYPHNSASDRLDPETHHNPSDYEAASQFLYRKLTGDSDGDPNTPADGKAFIEFLSRNTRRNLSGRVIAIVDPWRMSYGYSTRASADSSATYKLWSTGGEKTELGRKKWIKNW